MPILIYGNNAPLFLALSEYSRYLPRSIKPDAANHYQWAPALIQCLKKGISGSIIYHEALTPKARFPYYCNNIKKTGAM
ncbi:MAG: hypothetical protein OEV42_08035 [Deltaproteobacteria bacterium]|nr:hypothetical protein [Deltaproteobacteria bacterium]